MVALPRLFKPNTKLEKIKGNHSKKKCMKFCETDTVQMVAQIDMTISINKRLSILNSFGKYWFIILVNEYLLLTSFRQAAKQASLVEV